MKKGFMTLLNPKAWGISLFHSPSDSSPGQSLEVYRQMLDEKPLVGRLSCEQGEFVFRYDSNYREEPISAFPRIGHVYRSQHLWPFFAVRIPPVDREDIRQEIEERSLEEDQVLEILGLLAKVSVTSPYEFELAEDQMP
ncbi:MAG: hypothetical protein F4049_05765 [Gemmatimonadetes bacterium]|nr:hypothetical protein [Gemmatimonadota bacterium]